MKRITVVAIAALLSIPVTVIAADDEAGQSAVAAVSPQSENASDPASTDQPVAAAADKADKSDPAATPPKPAESLEIFNVISKTVDSLSQQVVTLRADVTDLQQQNTQLRQQLAGMQYTIYGLAGLVVLLGLLFSIRTRKKSSPHVVAPATPVAVTAAAEGEYDFMGSSEAIPAKLDLARAYIAMEDFAAARETLIEILTEGGAEHRLEAKSLFNKIKQ